MNGKGGMLDILITYTYSCVYLTKAVVLYSNKIGGRYFGGLLLKNILAEKIMADWLLCTVNQIG